MGSRSFVICMVLYALVGAMPSLAQEVVHWGDFDLCPDCRLEVRERVRLGDAEGPGIIESETVWVRWSPTHGHLVFESMVPRIKVFNAEGEFLRLVGRGGEGPGEFGFLADVHDVGGRIVALDGWKREWVIFDQAGKFVRQVRHGTVAGRFAPVNAEHVVVYGIDRRPNIVGYPLHLVDLTDGETVHFGAVRSEWFATWPYARSVNGSILSQPGTVWWSRLTNPEVQQWSADGELLRTITGDLPWFPVGHEEWRSYDEPAPTLFVGLAVDSVERLWMLTQRADPAWQGSGPSPGEEPEDDDYMDMRLDVFDLPSRRHLGHHIWDSGNAKLFHYDGEAVINVFEYSRGMVPQVVVYAVDWR